MIYEHGNAISYASVTTVAEGEAKRPSLFRLSSYRLEASESCSILSNPAPCYSFQASFGNGNPNLPARFPAGPPNPP